MPDRAVAESRRVRRLISWAFGAVTLFTAFSALAQQHVRWTANGVPTEAVITGGPWTLEQSGAANGRKSAGYCDADMNQIGNPGSERMQPYYFPSIHGHGRHLQGYFDWRPKDIDEAVAAAISHDAGFSWKFQQKVVELRLDCPHGDNGDNGDDDGQGHAYVIDIAGHRYLYTLIRANQHIDVDDLVIHELTPRPGRPLEGVPDLTDAPTDQDPQDPEPDFHTHGLVNPDGILAAIPGTSPLKIIYEQKILDGDESGDTALPPEQRCDTWWFDYYFQHGMLAPNHDITYLRLAETTDGVYFTDLGPLEGLNDITSVSVLGTRWVATAGTIIRLEGNRYGLFYSGGNCIDADSDSFHYIGYAESDDLIHWTVVNGLNHPIASIFPVSLRVNRDGVPAEGEGTRIVTVPRRTPIVGQAQGFMAGRVYAPSATLFQGNDITVIFAGYHTGKPKNALGDYRTIARVSLHSSRRLISVGQDGVVEEEVEASEPDSE